MFVWMVGQMFMLLRVNVCVNGWTNVYVATSKCLCEWLDKCLCCYEKMFVWMVGQIFMLLLVNVIQWQSERWQDYVALSKCFLCLDRALTSSDDSFSGWKDQIVLWPSWQKWLSEKRKNIYSGFNIKICFLGAGNDDMKWQDPFRTEKIKCRAYCCQCSKGKS